MENFTKEEFDKKLKKIYSELTEGIEISSKKLAFLLGGQPGAGKSGMTTLLEKENKNMIVINGDDFRKEHPHFIELQKMYGKESVEHTKTFAGKMTEALISKLSDVGYNLVIEGTLRTSETPNIDPAILISKEFQRALSEDEKNQLLKGYDKVLKHMYERRASKEEIAIIEKEKANSIKEIALENNKDTSSCETKLLNDKKSLTLGK